jgi:hypothetical protein
MPVMSGERFTNARVHEWLTNDIDAVVSAMSTTRVQLNSAAMWWFCRLKPEERAEILGEYVKVQALRSESEPAPLPPPDGRPRRRKPAEKG